MKWLVIVHTGQLLLNTADETQGRLCQFPLGLSHCSFTWPCQHPQTADHRLHRLLSHLLGASHGYLRSLKPASLEKTRKGAVAAVVASAATVVVGGDNGGGDRI